MTLYSKDRRRKKRIVRFMAFAMFELGIYLAAQLPTSTPWWHQAMMPIALAGFPYVAELMTPFVISIAVAPRLVPVLASMRCRRANVGVRRLRNKLKGHGKS